MARDTGWVWLTRLGDEAVLAFCYLDPSAGPSAKGAAVAHPPTREQIRAAVDFPNKTVREPERFGLIRIEPSEALKMGLPKDPPWMGLYGDKAVPPPRGEPSRTVRARVVRRGQPVSGARVRLGHAYPPHREFLRLDTRTSDASGSCAFPLAPMPAAGHPVVAIADVAGASSRMVDVPDDGDVVLELLPLGEISGMVTRAGVPVAGHVSITSQNGGMLRVTRGEPNGRFRVADVVPASYAVEVRGIHPITLMAAGTPTYDVIVVAPGEPVQRDFSLVAGVALRFHVELDRPDDNCAVYLFAGEQRPGNSAEIHALRRRMDKRDWRTSNSSSTKDTALFTELVDVAPGTYTVCAYPTCMASGDASPQPVTLRTLVVGDQDMDVSLVMPAFAPATPAPAAESRAPTRPSPPPLPTAVELFAGSTLSATLRKHHLLIRAHDAREARFHEDVRDVFDIAHDGSQLSIRGVFPGRPPAERYLATLTGPPQELADLAQALVQRLKPAGPLLAVDPTSVRSHLEELDGRVIRVAGAWERGALSSTLAGLHVAAEWPVGSWQVDMIGRVIVRHEGGEPIAEISPIETIVLNCLSDGRLTALDHKREMMLGERRVLFEMHPDDQWRVRVDGLPIPMKSKARVTSTGVNTDTREEKEAPCAWAKLGPALRDSTPWRVELGPTTTLSCAWMTSADCFNTVIYSHYDVELAFSAELSSVIITFVESTDMSS